MKYHVKAYQALVFLCALVASCPIILGMQADQGIAILGWGSLIWNPGDLKASAFRQGGPTLPIAFSRVSGDGRLTLVIDPQSEGERLPKNQAGRDIETWYARSEFGYAGIDAAIKNLRTREGCVADCIGYVNLSKRKFRITQLSPTTGKKIVIRGTIRVIAPHANDVDIVEGSGIRKELLPYLKEIIAWTKRKGYSATLWTDLQRNFQDKTGMRFSREHAGVYLASLRGEARRKAQEYIQKTPANVLHGTRDGDYFLQLLR